MQALQIETEPEPALHQRDADLDRITDFAQQCLRVDDAAVIRVGTPGGEGERSDVENRLADLVVDGDTIIAVPDVIFEQEVSDGPVSGFLGVPLRTAEGTPFAALYVVTRESRIWSRSDREMLGFLGAELEEIWRMREAVETETRRAAQHRLVAREYHHRIRNAFSVSSAVVVLTGAQCPSVQSLVETTSEQLAALANAHTAIAFDEEAADLTQLVEGALKPYTFSDATVDVSGPSVEIDEAKVISLSLILNELATNSTKYGAFRLGGGLRVTWTLEDGHVLLKWTERSGAQRMTRSTREGSFGGAMMDLSVAQLRAKMEKSWHRDGIEVCLSFEV